jgi:hypothetical protein
MTTNFAFVLGNLEPAFEDILGPSAGVIPPARDSKVSLLRHFLDNSRSGASLGDGCRDAGWASGSLDDTARSTDKDFSFTAGDLSLALSNIAFVLGKGLRPFRGEIPPDTFVHGGLRVWNDVRWYWGVGSGRRVLGG